MANDYPADLYAVTHCGTPGDLDFYRRVTADATRVLELGCGYGRILAGLLQAAPDLQLTGLDIDPELLTLARDRLGDRVRLVEDDMRSFALGDAVFDRVLLPHSGGYCLPGPTAVRQCFDRVFAHLRPGGVFALDAYAADAFHREARPDELDDDTLLPVAVVEARGATWHVLEQSTWLPAEQRIIARYVYSRPDEDRPPVGVIDQWYWLRSQLSQWLTETGFVDVQICGGFEGQPARRGDEHWAALARRPG